MEDKQKKVFEQYEFDVKSRYRTRGAWVLDTNLGVKLLREYEQISRHFYLENRIKDHLKKRGMNHLDFVVPNREGEPITEIENSGKYVITDWFYGEECDLKNQAGLFLASKNLASIHRCLEDFAGTEEETKDEDSSERFIRHNREMKRIYTYMRNKKRKNEFEIFAMDCFHYFYEQGCEAEELLYHSPYNRRAGIGDVCHGEYNHHNVIFSGDIVATCNFEKAFFAPVLMDLCYFLRKSMEKNNWDVSKGRSILEGYQSERKLSEEDIEFVYIQLLFPEKFWKLMNQYFNRKKSWMSQRNMEKLIGVKEQYRCV